MQTPRPLVLTAVCLAIFVTGVAGVPRLGAGDSNEQSAGQQPRQGAGRLQLEPLGAKNEAVFPYFEGWYNNDDGTATILLGYYNRNTDQPLDVPIGANNRIEPGGPDRGQPTHFLPRRQYGVFTITVPKEAGTQKITWTLTANNLTNAVTVWLNPPYFVEPFKNIANGNTPPRVRFGETAPVLQGPPRSIAQTLDGAVNQPVTLSVLATDFPATYDAVNNKFLTPEEVAQKQAKEASEGGAANRPARPADGTARTGGADSGPCDHQRAGDSNVGWRARRRRSRGAGRRARRRRPSGRRDHRLDEISRARRRHLRAAAGARASQGQLQRLREG
jgi:hypothetical protein